MARTITRERQLSLEVIPPEIQESGEKFENPDWTAKGEERAKVALEDLETLWINTGTLCNITCKNCYIESSPENDRLVYLNAGEVVEFLDEAVASATREIGITGGEPFMNPDILQIMHDALLRGFEVLVLTNAMQPMQRPRIREGLLFLADKFGDKLTLRVSIDHYTRERHEVERGPDTWDKTIDGLSWLAKHKFNIAIAGRTCWDEDEAQTRIGFEGLIKAHNWPIDPTDHKRLMLLPEMDSSFDVPEITTACWSILGKKPGDVMCARSRMIVKRKGAEKPTVLPCTLLPYDEAFEMGDTLNEASRADGGMFETGQVKLCHPHCAKFCVLGGGSCS